MYFFEGGDLKVQLSLKFERCEHRDDTTIVYGDQEVVKCQLPFVLKDQVKKMLSWVGGIELCQSSSCV